MAALPDRIKPSTEVIVYHPQPLANAHIADSDVARKTDSVFRSSLRAQIADYSHFHRYWMGDIIVLIGNSTAGKTSIIQSLRQMEPDRIEDGVDLKSSADVLHFLQI